MTLTLARAPRTRHNHRTQQHGMHLFLPAHAPSVFAGSRMHCPSRMCCPSKRARHHLHPTPALVPPSPTIARPSLVSLASIARLRRRSPLARHSPSLARHSPSLARHSPSLARRSPLSARRCPPVVARCRCRPVAVARSLLPGRRCPVVVAQSPWPSRSIFDARSPSLSRRRIEPSSERLLPAARRTATGSRAGWRQ